MTVIIQPKKDQKLQETVSFLLFSFPNSPFNNVIGTDCSFSGYDPTSNHPIEEATSSNPNFARFEFDLAQTAGRPMSLGLPLWPLSLLYSICVA